MGRSLFSESFTLRIIPSTFIASTIKSSLLNVSLHAISLLATPPARNISIHVIRSHTLFVFLLLLRLTNHSRFIAVSYTSTFFLLSNQLISIVSIYYNISGLLAFLRKPAFQTEPEYLFITPTTWLNICMYMSRYMLYTYIFRSL